MGLFGKLFGSDNEPKGKSTNGQLSLDIDDDLRNFLEEADKLYIKAFETRSIGILKEYFTRDCCMALSRWIVNEASSRFFGDKKFRNTTWEMVQNDGNLCAIIKTCVYKDIHLTMSRTMKVSDDYREKWIIQVTPDEYWVESITLEE